MGRTARIKTLVQQEGESSISTQGKGKKKALLSRQSIAMKCQGASCRDSQHSGLKNEVHKVRETHVSVEH